MKKTKKINRLIAMFIVSIFCISAFALTAFAWDSAVTVMPQVTNDSDYPGYLKVTFTQYTLGLNITGFTVVGVNYLDNSSIVSGNRIYSASDTFYIANDNTDLAPILEVDDSNIVANGGVVYFYSPNGYTNLMNYLDSINATYVEPDPVGELFDNITIGVNGSMTSVGSVASALTSNILLTIMCIALPLVSVGVGFFVRLKNKA